MSPRGGQGPGGVTGVAAAVAMFWWLASFEIPMVRLRRGGLAPADLPARESARGELNRRLSGSVPVMDEYLRWPLPGALAVTSPAQAPDAAQAAAEGGAL
jgi:hypothetical protein